MVDFRAIIENLQAIHFYDVLLPFVLVYAVVFAILEKSGIFKSADGSSNTKSVNAVIAFVFGLFVVASLQTVLYIQSLITAISVFIVFILVVLILLGFIFGNDYMKIFQKDDGKLNWKVAGPVAAVILIVSLIVLAVITGAWSWFWDWYDSIDFANETFTTIIVLVLIGGVLFWISKGDSPKPASK